MQLYLIQMPEPYLLPAKSQEHAAEQAMRMYLYENKILKKDADRLVSKAKSAGLKVGLMNQYGDRIDFLPMVKLANVKDVKQYRSSLHKEYEGDELYA